MIDPEYNYCPSCHDEFMPKAQTCLSCNVTLLSGSEMLKHKLKVNQEKIARKGDLTGNDEIVTVHKAALAEIKKLEKLCQDENIGVLVVSEDGGCNKGCCPSSYYLQVRKEDGMVALALIKKEFARTTGVNEQDLIHADNVFDGNVNQAICPACGFLFQTTTTTCPDCGLCFG